MARIESQVRLGYYPTPDKTLALVCSALRPAAATPEDGGKGLQLLDPCAGTGAALTRISASLRQQTGSPVVARAIELESARARECREVIPETLNCSCFDASCSKEATSLLLLNPPYDWDHQASDHRAQRLEKSFYQATLDYLAPEGVLVFIIPIAVAQDVHLAKSLSYRFLNLRIFKLPEGEFERFSQVVIFGVRRRHDTYTEGGAREVVEMVNNAEGLDKAAGSFQYDVPAVKAPTVFRDFHPSVADMEKELPGSPLLTELGRVLAPPESVAGLHPMMPLSVGHLATLLTAGVINGLIANGAGELIVVKGFAQQVSSTRKERDPDTGEHREVETRHTAVTVRYFNQEGKLFLVK